MVDISALTQASQEVIIDKSVYRVGYKLLRKMKNGAYKPLFINKKVPFPFMEVIHGGDYPTKGYGHRPGLHVTNLPDAPWLRKHTTGEYKSNRVWCLCLYNVTKDYGNGCVVEGKGLPFVPKGGYYVYKESNLGNWHISGDMILIKEVPENERLNILREAGYSQSKAWSDYKEKYKINAPDIED